MSKNNQMLAGINRLKNNIQNNKNKKNNSESITNGIGARIRFLQIKMYYYHTRSLLSDNELIIQCEYFLNTREIGIELTFDENYQKEERMRQLKPFVPHWMDTNTTNMKAM